MMRDEAPVLAQDMPQDHGSHLRLRHLRFGWTALLFFAALGMTLELLHGFKVGWYVDVTSETRRLMWRLAHSHGTFLALVNVVFGLCLHCTRSGKAPGRRVASACMIVSALLVPGGFFLGGLQVYSGDPSLGIMLVPLGTVALLLALGLVVRDLARGKPSWVCYGKD